MKKIILYTTSAILAIVAVCILVNALKPVQRTETEVVNTIQQNVAQSVQGNSEQKDNTDAKIEEPQVTVAPVVVKVEEPQKSEPAVAVANEVAVASTEPTKNTATITKVENYTSPVDFDKLHEYNQDIYAWLYIEGTVVNYPICQSPDDDMFYLWHGENRAENPCGALYTEATYNDKEFQDPVTVIYGHRLDNGTMFGWLRDYFSDDSALEKYPEIIVYMPDKELHYSLISGFKHDDRHLIYTYSPNGDNANMEGFLADVTQPHSIGAYTNPNLTPTDDDNYLVLSTCTTDGRTNRFLVVSMLSEIISKA